MSNIPMCEEIDCLDDADVTLVNNRVGTEHAYCIDHAEEALSTIGSLNVGASLQ